MLRQEQESEPQNEVRYEPKMLTPTQNPPIQTTAMRRKGERSALTRGAENFDRSWLRPYRIGLTICALSFLLGIPTMALLWRLFPTLPTLGFGIGAGMLSGGLIGIPAILITLFWKITHSASYEPMPPEEDVRSIGPLLDRMTTDIPKTPEIQKRLIKLLPRLQAEDAALLEPRHYDMLNAYLHKQAWSSRLLRRDEKAGLVAVLDAYSRIGDGRALPDVQRLAQSVGFAKTALVVRDAEVRAAAQRCLPHLQQAAEALRQKETLLRSSEIPVAQETLLRPAAFASGADPAHLLRPTNTDTDAS